MGLFCLLFLLTCFAVLSSANPQWLNASASVYLAGRIAHMLFYYLNIRVFRSISFAVSLMGLAAMFIVGALFWW